MNATLAWLNDIIQWIGRWIPRMVLIHPTMRGVRFGPRGGAHAVGPGLVVYWPITHDVVVVPVTTQSVQLCGQILPMAQNGSFLPRVTICTLNVQFHIADPVVAATRVLHFQALVGNRAQSALVKYWTGVAGNAREVVARAHVDAHAELSEYGVTLTAMDVANLGEGVVVKNVADWTLSDWQQTAAPASAPR